MDGVEYYERKIKFSMAGIVASEMCVPGSEFEKICFHEAGHAAVCRHFHGKMIRVEVKKDLGGCCYHGEQPEQTEALAETLENIPSDQDKIAEATRILVLGGFYPNLKDLRIQTAEIVKQHWAEISRIVRELLAQAKETGSAELTTSELEGLWYS